MNDTFPKLSDVTSGGKDAVVPFVQSGYYFAFSLAPGAHTLNFGGTSDLGSQEIIYNVLNLIEGTLKADTLNGSEFNDYISGGDGKDTLSGYDGDDLILGGQGGDSLNGGKGNDELWGDDGPDTFIFRKGYGQDTIYDLKGKDKVDIEGLRVSQGSLSELQLPGGLSTQIDFRGGNLLTLVGVTADRLNISNGNITLQQGPS